MAQSVIIHAVRLAPWPWPGEVLGSTFYRDEGITTGLYVAGRIQTDSEDTFLNAAAFDRPDSTRPGTITRILGLAMIAW